MREEKSDVVNVVNNYAIIVKGGGATFKDDVRRPLPYHIGNGIFGGLVPLIATALAVGLNDPLGGLWYPIGVAGICFVIGTIFLTNKQNTEVME